MNIEIIKNKIKLLLNCKIKIKKNIGRNKYEYYEGYIDKMYSNIFTIKTDKCILAVSYSDIITKNIIITKFS